MERRKAILRRLQAEAGSTDILARQMALMAHIGGDPVTAGNQVTLLIDDSATYSAMFEAIKDAQDHINLETFILSDDQTGSKLADLLLQKRGEGVEVNLIYDSVGSYETSPSFFRRLRDAGIRVLEFNPPTPEPATVDVGSWMQRDHRKILIVDGRIAFTGGVNISKGYSESLYGEIGGKASAHHWRDTDIRIEGPAVAQFQKLFLETWKRQGGPKLSERDYFPPLKNKGNALVRVVASSAGKENRLTYLMYLSAVRFSERSVHLTNAYFVPDEDMMNALVDAAKRDVDVKIVLSGATDSALVFVAARSFYTRLLEAGVKLYERRDAILHAKTGVIDGLWSTVGSTNMDFWSFLRDNEVNAVIIGPEFARKMEALFKTDLDASEPVRLDEWKNRPWTERFMEWFVRYFAYWL